MSLIIYPTASYDSFVDVTEATTLLTANVIDLTLWTDLTTTHKEVYLRQATKLISFRIDLDLIEDTTNLELATALLANYSINKDMTKDDGKANLKVLSIDGALSKEWFGKGKKSNSFPDMVLDLLKEYGVSSSGIIRIERA